MDISLLEMNEYLRVDGAWRVTFKKRSMVSKNIMQVIKMHNCFLFQIIAMVVSKIMTRSYALNANNSHLMLLSISQLPLQLFEALVSSLPLFF